MPRERPVMVAFEEYIQTILVKQPTLDLGCSMGNYLRYFQRESIGVDVDWDDLLVCRERGLTVIKGNLNKTLPFPDRSFQQVFCSHVLEHVDAPIVLLRECNRVLELGGKLVLGLPVERNIQGVLGTNRYFQDHDGHLYAFTVKNSQVLLKRTGFGVKRVFLEPWPSAKLGSLGLLGFQLRLIQLLPKSTGLFISNGYWIVASKMQSL